MVETLYLEAIPDINNFDEAGYLAANSDVAAAIKGGALLSGLDHFKGHGQAEGRRQRVLTDYAKGVAEIGLISGGNDVFAGSPGIEVVQDALYIPFPSTGSYDEGRETWGIYSGGRLLDSAAFKRGADGAPVGQHPSTTLRSFDTSVDEVLIYAGIAHFHFGHFLLSSLSRLWPRFDNVKFLIHGNIDGPGWFTFPFVAEILGSLGLTADSFVRFTEPIVIKNLIVPRPSFQELHSAHRCYGDLGQAIGVKIAGAGMEEKLKAPVYLTKREIKSGVWSIENEDELIDVLVKHGIEIIALEKLSLARQINLLQSNDIIAPMGSPHHLSALSEAGCDMKVLCLDNKVWSNFSMIDKIKGNRTQYVFPVAGVERKEVSDGFHQSFRLIDPVGTAEGLLRLLE